MTEQGNKRMRRWMLAGGWTGLIYSTLYIIRPVCEFLKEFPWFSLSVNSAMVVTVLFLAAFFVRKGYIQKPATYVYLFLILAGYFLGMAWLSIPEERLHFVEYGILAFLIYRAVSLDLQGGWAYLVAFLITFLIGWGDEGIQYLLPNRYYQLKDVCLNGVSAAMGLALVHVLMRDRKSG